MPGVNQDSLENTLRKATALYPRQTGTKYSHLSQVSKLAEVGQLALCPSTTDYIRMNFKQRRTTDS